MCRGRALLGSCRISSQRASFKPSLGGGYPPPRWITAYFLLDLDVRLHREVLLDQAVGAAVLRRLRDTVHVGKRAVVDEVAGVGRGIGGRVVRVRGCDVVRVGVIRGVVRALAQVVAVARI